MTQNPEAFAIYQATFPSKDFLQKYYGIDHLVKGNPHRREIDLPAYKIVHDILDYILRCIPGHLLASNKPETGKIEVFIDGKPAQWIIESKRLEVPDEIAADFWHDLASEFIQHCLNNAFHERDWWRWNTEGLSIWIETIPGKSYRARKLGALFTKP